MQPQLSQSYEVIKVKLVRFNLSYTISVRIKVCKSKYWNYTEILNPKLHKIIESKK